MGWTPVLLVAVRVLAISRAIGRQPTTTFRSPAMVVGSTARPRCLRSWRRSTRDELLHRVVADDTVNSFDPDRVLTTLARHGVEYLLVGGLAARAHGAQRQTADVDCVPNTTNENLARMATALIELDGRLRVGGLSDDEARQLPVTIDAETLLSFGSSTWMTNAGPLDLLVELRDRIGGRHDYAELSARAVGYDVGELTVQLASLDDIIASKEFAGRDKDRDALPELNELLRRRPPR